MTPQRPIYSSNLAIFCTIIALKAWYNISELLEPPTRSTDCCDPFGLYRSMSIAPRKGNVWQRT